MLSNEQAVEGGESNKTTIVFNNVKIVLSVVLSRSFALKRATNKIAIDRKAHKLIESLSGG